LIVDERLQSFKLHVSTLQTPFVTLLEQQRVDEPCDRGVVGEDTDDGASFDLGASDGPTTSLRALVIAFAFQFSGLRIGAGRYKELPLC
jgi:hypothetical protein